MEKHYPSEYGELYDSIYLSLESLLGSETIEERLVLAKLTGLATEGAKQHIYELTESITHLQETVKRLAHVDN